MKYGTLVFTRNVSTLYQLEVIGSDKRNLLLQEWSKGVKENNLERLRELIKEVLSVADEHSKKELKNLLETLD